MTLTFLAAATPVPKPASGPSDAEYRPGACNISPAEIARRRRAGHIGLIVTAVVLATLVAAHAPPLARLIVGLPAAGAASGYLQAIFKFCAGFAARGLFNFGELGQTEQIADVDARARDRTRANQILVGSLAIGILVAIVAAILPL